jgi:F0F1-type ATP synthase assembly protein I
MKNNSAILGMIFGAGIGIIFGSTGLGLPMGAGVGLVIGMIIENQKKKK